MNDVQSADLKEWWRVGESQKCPSDQGRERPATLPASPDAARAVEQHGLRFLGALQGVKTPQETPLGVLGRVLENGGEKFVSRESLHLGDEGAEGAE